MYTPPPLTSDAAHIKIARDRPRHVSLRFHRIDGEVPTLRGELLTGGPYGGDTRPITVAPGKHKIIFAVASRMYGGRSELWLVAQPGGIYSAHVQITGYPDEHTAGYRFAVWITDDATGNRVGGVRGSDDEPTDGDKPIDW
jgi:hypothetical protein